MIGAVVFDLDDTLYDYAGLDREASEKMCALACERLAVSPEKFREAYAAARRDTKSVLGGTAAGHNRVLYCQRALEILGERPVSLALDLYDAYWGYMLEHMRLRDGAGELLSYCEAQGITVGICTDLTAHIQHRKIRALGLEERVDVLVTSEEAGAEKPSPAIYRLTLSKLGMEPGRVLFIGDSCEKDVEGPRTMGMRAFWLHDEGTGGPPDAIPFGEIRRIINGR